MIKRIVSFVLALVLFSLLCSCEGGVKNYSSTFLDYFDTFTTVSGYFKSQQEFDEVNGKIKSFLENYHKMFDIYNNYDKMNNIKTINDNAGVKPVKVNSEIIELLEFSVDVYELTDGMVNVCAGSLISLWKTSLDNGKIPQAKNLTDYKSTISIDNLVINNEKSTVFLKSKQCKIDVGAVAKGFVGKKLKDFAKSISFENGIINLGGNVVAIGTKPNNKKFTVGIANPQKTSKNLCTVGVSNQSVVTSGDYERFYEIDGKRFNHIINTKSGYPADNNKSATIISSNPALADALSTALFIMNSNEGIKLVNSLENCEAVVVDSNNEQYFSNGFKKYLENEE